MTGPRLRSLSVILLSALIGVSAARVVCLLPCVLDQVSAADAPHCGHEGTGGASTVSAPLADCGDCDRIQLEDADRRPSRHSPSTNVGTALASLPQVAGVTAVSVAQGPANAPPCPPSPPGAPLPLRI